MMKYRLSIGEAVLGLVFVGTGLFWIFGALRLQLWDGFSPGTGFLPLVFGILMVALAGAAILVDAVSTGEPGADHSPIRKPVLVILALGAGVAGIELVGFAVAMFLAMLFLYHVAERIPLPRALLIAATTAIMLTVIFRLWLGVPLPVGPLGV